MKPDWCRKCGYREDLHPVKGVFLNCKTFEPPEAKE